MNNKLTILVILICLLLLIIIYEKINLKFNNIENTVNSDVTIPKDFIITSTTNTITTTTNNNITTTTINVKTEPASLIVDKKIKKYPRKIKSIKKENKKTKQIIDIESYKEAEEIDFYIIQKDLDKISLVNNYDEDKINFSGKNYVSVFSYLKNKSTNFKN